MLSTKSNIFKSTKLFYPSKRYSTFDEKQNCLNDYRSLASNSIIILNNNKNNNMKRRHQHRSNLSSSTIQRMMINDDHKHNIKLMQQQQHSSSSHVNHHLKSISSSRIRLGLRCLVPFNDKQQQFDDFHSFNEKTKNISDSIFNQYISRITTTYINTLIILFGQSCEIRQIQNTLLSLTINHLHYFLIEKNHNLILRIHIQEFSRETYQNNPKTILLSNDYSLTCPIQTSQYLNHLCSNHQTYPLLITFQLIYRLSNIDCVKFHILSTNETINNFKQDDVSNILMSLSSFLPSNRQQQSFHSSNHEQSSLFSSLTSILNEYVHNIDEHFLYILANVNNDKQLKYWTKIQRFIKSKQFRSNMSYRDSTSFETIRSRTNKEIWVDGPLSSSTNNNNNNEIWIDGPHEYSPKSSTIIHKRSTPKHRSKPMHTKPKISTVLSPRHTLSPYSNANNHMIISEPASTKAFDTESVVSSHCHLPVLPVFKDHSLLPFRSNQTVSKSKLVTSSQSPTIDLKLSANKLNDDLEMLEKTLETLLVPSPIVPNKIEQDLIMTKSLNRIDQLSSLMSNDEKTKRLSRIVSPTRFDKILSSNNAISSIKHSPIFNENSRHSRISNNSLETMKKPQVPIRTTSLAETNSRPSILQRLFGLRSPQTYVIQSPPSSPLISPLTVTLDSRDDLMPLTTSSTASSASGRASSSGYESIGNTILDDMFISIPSNENNLIKIRSKTITRDDRKFNGSPKVNNVHRQQRINQLKQRQNELRIQLAMTKTLLNTDKTRTKNFDFVDSVNSTMNNSPVHMISTNNHIEEDELEKDIEYLEKRLASTKSQLMLTNYQKQKQSKF